MPAPEHALTAVRGRSVGTLLLDLAGGVVGSLLSAPLIGACALAIWAGDRRNPFYVSDRIGRGGRAFRFVKIRTMVPNAAASKVDTTIAGDPRILAAGRVIRDFKFDELPQFWHVLTGHMSLVGPRPNVPREVALYTAAERGLLAVRPGITDPASIVFADLANVLAGHADANIAYNQLVRPWKSALSLHYLHSRSTWSDLLTVFYTASNVVARRWTLARIVAELERTGADPALIAVARRDAPLRAAAPPGADHIVTSREPGGSAN
jgi:lipopolysaccharide/colanic/teichoic acid biosynthesis glycosyltransferase